MSEQPLVSIIIPVYNVEQYLRECLDSVISQTYRNLEIIIVNDGSPDGSGSICEEYAAKDSRIIYFVKENGGLSDARNFGMHHVSGDCIPMRRSWSGSPGKRSIPPPVCAKLREPAPR